MMTPELETQLVRLIGSVSGAALAFLVHWPKDWRDFWRRLAASLIFGMIAGPVVFEWSGLRETPEARLASCALAGLVAWTVLPGILKLASGINWGKVGEALVSAFKK